MQSAPQEITRLLLEMNNGGEGVESRLAPMIYNELHRLAACYMRHERAGHTLQATALVHEAYLRLVEQRGKRWQNRAHFFGVAAQVMRRFLVDYARAHRTQKRGGEHVTVSLDEALLLSSTESLQLIALDEALERLAQWDPRQSRIVELRFFGGLAEEEIAELLGVTSRTVRREWSMAKAWLQGELSK